MMGPKEMPAKIPCALAERNIEAMTPIDPSRDWAALRWPQLSGTAPARWIAVLPLAATEQHGPHLPLGTDSMIAEAYLARVRELLPTTLAVAFLPVQPIGISTEHIDYPGTLTLSPEIAIRSWMEIGGSLARAGLKKIVMVTSHGGNSAAMTLVAQELRAQWQMAAVTTAWSRLSGAEHLFPAEEVRHGVHGGAVETSIMLARYPQHVEQAAIANFPSRSIVMEKDYRRLSTQRPAPLAWQAQDLNDCGAVGDATLGSAAKGEQLLNNGAAAFCELLADLDRFDAGTLSSEPSP